LPSPPEASSEARTRSPVLSDRELLGVWEAGQGHHPVSRALDFLAATLRDADRDRLASMSIGLRDRHLMDARAANFGSAVRGLAECPGCGEDLEWTLDLDDVRSAPDDGPGGATLFSADGYEVQYRLPDSTDLAAVAAGGDAVTGRSALLRRCVLEARRDDVEVEVGLLPEPVVSGLADVMEARDPQAETLLDFDCPACGTRWQAPFDVLTFLWDEVCARARHLLAEVHYLASAYGWAEADVLSMSAVRRQFYLDTVT
jgi:hypothetical protein